MLNNNNPIFIRFADEFENSLYSLSKRYRNIRKDIEIVLEQIQSGNFIGDRIAGLGEDCTVTAQQKDPENLVLIRRDPEHSSYSKYSKSLQYA